MAIPSRGVIVPLVTPFTSDEEVNFSGFKANIEHYAEKRVAGLLVMPTAGEAPSLDLDEKLRLIDTTLGASAGRLPVIVGVGGTNIRETAALIRHAEAVGVDGIFVITPYFYRVTRMEYVAYFRRIAESTALPMMLYNSTYAGSPITPDVLEELLQFGSIVAIKEGNQLQAVELIRRFGDRLSVFTARDLYVYETLALGGHGTVSFASNVVPELVADLFAACARGDWEHGRALQFRLNPLVNELVARSYPAPIKAAMDIVGLCGGNTRAPLVPLDGSERKKLQQVISDLMSESSLTNVMG